MALVPPLVSAVVPGTKSRVAVLDLAAFFTGGDVTQLGGDFTVEARATGTREEPRIEVPKMTLRSGDLTANVTASMPDELP